MITGAGTLSARFVIHTVGPVWNDGRQGEVQKLALAVENGCTTVAFPNISTGVYGYPKDKAAAVAYQTVADFLSGNDTIGKVYFVCFDEANYEFLSAAANS